MTNPDQSPARSGGWRAELSFFLILLAGVAALHSLIAKPFYIPSESMMPGLRTGDRLVVSKYPYGWSYVSASFGLLPFRTGRVFGRLPARGDIVTLTPPGPDRRQEDLIKRVIGLPGDHVRVVGGRLWLNGRRVASHDLGFRMLPVDGNFPCLSDNASHGFWGFVEARVAGRDGKIYCRVNVIRETLPDGRFYDTLDFGRSDLDDFGPYVVPADTVFVMGDNRDNSADSRVPRALGGLGGAVRYENIGGRAEFITFSLNGNATLNPVTWPFGIRGERVFKSLRPRHASPGNADF